MLWIIIGVSVVMHEGAHMVAGRWFGGRWLGIRVRWTRISVVMNLTGVSVRSRRCIAIAGLAVDGGFWLGFLIGSLLKKFSSPIMNVGLIWFTLILLVNATPWIPGSDGWKVWHHRKGGAE
ncbi:MAG: hypothetical protein C7B43_09765 [Sulfobacillus benefaciens]|uniref:Peptidase M50 domain-containing protein n=1 Tax=Sulfobacillus benefaciens TaxID=453960 RepID=A0A2T2X2G1_9FIRM|nr:MAG: hypothetical protein C7B43_09765 [Sulfobacillus benefaciens]